MTFFSPWWRRAVHVAIVNHQIERLQPGIRRISAVHGLAFVTDDHVLDQPPDDVVEDRHPEQRQAPRPGDEHSAKRDERDAGSAVEVFLKVELVVIASCAAADERVRRRRDDGCLAAAMLANARRLPRFTGEPFLAFAAEEIDGGHYEALSSQLSALSSQGLLQAESCELRAALTARVPNTGCRSGRR